MASKAQAAAAFRDYCRQNDITFHIPLIGDIQMGDAVTDVLERFTETCRRNISVGWDEKGNCILSDKNGAFLTLELAGTHVSGISYEGIAGSVPGSMQYAYKKGRYVTDGSIDGYMMAMEGSSRIRLKTAKSMPQVAYESSAFPSRPQPRDRDFANRIRTLSGKLNAAGERYRVVRPGVDAGKLEGTFVKEQTEINRLDSRLFTLEEKGKNLQFAYSRARRELQEAESRYSSACSLLKGTYSETYYDKIPLASLIADGKLKIGDMGVPVFSPDAVDNTYWATETKTEFTESEYSHLPGWKYFGRREEVISDPITAADMLKDRYLDGNFPKSGTSSETIYEHCRDVEVNVEHRDFAYHAAKNWTNSREYGRYYKEVAGAYAQLEKARGKVQGCAAALDEYRKSPEYEKACTEKYRLQSQKKEAEARKAACQGELWDDGLLSLKDAVGHLGSNAAQRNR